MIDLDLYRIRIGRFGTNGKIRSRTKPPNIYSSGSVSSDLSVYGIMCYVFYVYVVSCILASCMSIILKSEPKTYTNIYLLPKFNDFKWLNQLPFEKSLYLIKLLYAKIVAIAIYNCISYS